MAKYSVVEESDVGRAASRISCESRCFLAIPFEYDHVVELGNSLRVVRGNSQRGGQIQRSTIRLSRKRPDPCFEGRRVFLNQKCNAKKKEIC